MSDQHYRVSIGTYDLELEELHHPAGAAPISFVPVVAGAGAVGRIIAGVVLIALSFGIATLAAGAALAGSLSGFALQAIAFGTQAGLLAGLGLAIGGVAQLLTPVPKVAQGANNQDDPRKSYSFSGIQNTSRAGTPVPIVYGETVVGSVVISAGIDTVQVAA